MSPRGAGRLPIRILHLGGRRLGRYGASSDGFIVGPPPRPAKTAAAGAAHRRVPWLARPQVPALAAILIRRPYLAGNAGRVTNTKMPWHFKTPRSSHIFRSTN